MARDESGNTVSCGIGRLCASRSCVPRDRRVRQKACDVGAWLRACSAAETGWPGYDPRDLLKLYLYGYLNQIQGFGWRLQHLFAEVTLHSGSETWLGYPTPSLANPLSNAGWHENERAMPAD